MDADETCEITLGPDYDPFAETCEITLGSATDLGLIMYEHALYHMARAIHMGVPVIMIYAINISTWHCPSYLCSDEQPLAKYQPNKGCTTEGGGVGVIICFLIELLLCPRISGSHPTCLDPAANSLCSRISGSQPTCLDLPILA
jgi:hypothetical protein